MALYKSVYYYYYLIKFINNDLLHQVWPKRLAHNGLVCAPGGRATPVSGVGCPVGYLVMHSVRVRSAI